MDFTWQLQPIFESYALIGLVALVLGALTWWSCRQIQASPTQRRWLMGLRLATLIGLLILMLRPTWIYEQEDQQRRTVAVLLDQSLSMATTDVQGASRWSALRETILNVWPQLEEHAEELEFVIYRFDKTAQPSSGTTPQALLQAPPTGTETDLGSSLHDVLQQQLGRQLTAVILVSDGAQRAAQPRVELFDPARQLQRLDVPLYTLSFGQAADPSETRDVALAELPDQFRVFVNTAWQLTGALEVQGYANQALPVHVKLEGADGKVVDLPSQEVTAQTGQTSVNYQFAHTPTQPGQYKVTVSVPPQNGEVVTDNNQLVSYLTVLDGGIRVLQMESNWIAPEYKFRRRALGSAPAIELQEMLVDWRARSSWPLTLSQQHDVSQFDVIVLGDVHSQALSKADWEAIAERVEKGAGLLMTGGVHLYGAGGYAETAIGKLLPIETNRLERQDPNPSVAAAADLQLSGPQRMQPTTDHFVTRLGLARNGKSSWDDLPPLNGAYHFQKLKPTAFLLAATPEKKPLLVAGQYGSGRVLAFAGDSTYRWWLRGYSAQHQRFWRQMILWLANKEDLSRNELRIRLDRRRVIAGSPVSVEIEVLDENGSAIPTAEVTAQLKGPNGQTLPIRLVKRGDGWGAELTELSEIGDYEVLATSSAVPVEPAGGDTTGNPATGSDAGAGGAAGSGGAAAESLTATSKFVVFRQDWERLDPAANPDQLRRLAEVTRDAGGRLIAPEELSTVVDEIAARPIKNPVHFQRRWQLGETPWDAIAGFTLIGATLAYEWYLRKKWGLV